MTARTYVALDIETTGLDPEQDRVTEIGAVRFTENGDVLESFETFVNPGRPIPQFVQQLTGVTDDLVRHAPPLDLVAERLRAFVGNGPLVGQNIGFDLAHLRRGGIELHVPAIDTAELSRLLLPLAQARGLMELAQTLGVEAGEHHRALPDAHTAAAIFVALRGRADALAPAQRLQLARLISLHNEALAEVIAGTEWQDLPPGERLMPVLKPPPQLPQLVRREPREPVPAAQVRDVFAAAIRTLRDFEKRPEQLRMAEAVRESLSAGGHWLMEAGTGVGKSLAYLVPAALHALRNGERVVISTNTIALQEQLLSKDIPALRRILVAAGVIEDEAGLRASLLKGRGNYLCLKRWTAGYAMSMADPDFAHLGAAMLLWLPETETGDRSELNFDSYDYRTWQRFSAQDTDCLQRQNPWVRDGTCFLQRARKAAESAHLLIVNHALLLADLASGGSALPPYDHLVLDEAHNLEDQATKQFGGTVAARIVFEALEGIYRRAGRDQRESGVAAILRAFPEGTAKAAGDELEAAVAKALSAVNPCFEALAAHVPRGPDDDRVLLGPELRSQPSWLTAQAAWDTLDRALRAVHNSALTAARIVNDTRPVEEPDALAGEIESAARKVEDVRDRLRDYLTNLDDDTIVWLSRDGKSTAAVSAAPLDVGPTLWEELFSRRRTVVATSATLSAAGSMEYAARRLGLESPRTLQLGSPFDYQQSTLLAALTDVPEPNEPGYHQAVAQAIIRLTLASEGRALALFTSTAALNRVTELVRPKLEDAGIAVQAQDIDGSARQLTENLRRTPRTLVLGNQGFWEGVDIRGDALSMLIITRLPFSPPTDPVHRARSEQYANPFGQYSLPAAILKFRQGFGRLIRDRTDRGVVAVLDRRIYSRRYGDEFVSALPACTRIKTSSDVVALRAAEWLEL
ncbi:MAG: exonuclease domain-containing protein [Dehalococcoidia bacterium]|nr:exonuclease domain-containing protein [Dehalococcoidia bacterium]